MIKSINTKEDLLKLSKVLSAFYKIMKYDQLPITEENVILWVDRWKALIDSNNGQILCLFKDDEIIGAIGFIFSPSLEDGVLTCTEAFWYVDENNRGKGLSLLLHLQKIAKARGAKRLLMVHLNHSMPEKLKSVYERLGFSAIETIYMKQL